MRESVKYPETMSPLFASFLQVSGRVSALKACACTALLPAATLGAFLPIVHVAFAFMTAMLPSSWQGLLEKQPSLRLDWPQLMDHPFLAETAADKERAAREAAREAAAAEPAATPTLASRVQRRTADDADQQGALLGCC